MKTSWVDLVLFGIMGRFLLGIQDLENLIHAVPTGEKRNLLTEANIHIQAAQAKLREAVEGKS